MQARDVCPLLASQFCMDCRLKGRLTYVIQEGRRVLISYPQEQEVEAGVASTRTPFEKLTPIHPNRRITLETGATPVATRLIDLFVPLGFGQRALVVAPPQAGKTTILRQAATAILANHPQAGVFLCLVDER